jgi:hypothetical protein
MPMQGVIQHTTPLFPIRATRYSHSEIMYIRRPILRACFVLVILASFSFAEKSPPPDLVSLAQANRSVRKIFEADIAKARTPQLQTELAKKLLQAAEDEKTNTTNRYAVLLLARDIATSAGDVDTSATIANGIINSFSVDPLKLRLEIAQDLEKSVRAPYAKSDLIHFYNGAIIDAIQAEQFEFGRRIAAAAQAFARKTDDPALPRLVTAASQRLQEAQTAFNTAKKAQATLAQNPNDPAANLLIGKYYCFYKSDWAQGLPLLARTSDAALTSLAAREQAGSPKPTDQVNLADDWWSYSETSPGSTKAVIQSHAVMWYRKALPDLSGLTKTRVEKRLAAARLANAAEGELLPTMNGNFTADETGIVILHRGDRIKTPESFVPPVVFRIVAQTEKHNIRIAFAAEQIILNWEGNPTELRVDGGPGGGRYKAGAGQVPIKTWVTIDLLVRPRLMAISVDGQLRHEIQADFSRVDEPLQIFAPDSTLKIKSVRVRQLAQ